ncbi:OmpA family protein [Brachymonas denitrificans]|jgi:outer membrane protein OmpA-like peptidoglycan-associated protein|uniref:Outer membrane protein OmpA n=1 Tax=Brachymonas denitrificans DSM 15123 TaxID=1121117 RepID=A0A1H8J2N5_9BURK|nr:OmpA family protein [Brachymonas denitrificans]SEN74665.1 Outer membrane protein OmpA [Brachymonas denitrificans DSM 15123]
MAFNTNDDDREQKTVVGFLIGAVVLLAIAIAVGFGVSRAGVFGKKDGAASTGSSVMAAADAASGAAAADGAASAAGVAAQAGAASADQGAAVQAGADEASVKVVDGVVRFYFASGKAELAAGAKEALADAVAAAKAGKKLVLSGFHDSTGDPARNAELAKQRAFAVRDALIAEGVAEGSIDLQKPEAMPNTQGNDPEARRVEVKID